MRIEGLVAVAGGLANGVLRWRLSAGAVLALLTGTLVAAAGPERAQAAEEYWQGFGFGYSDNAKQGEKKERQPDPQNDLRTDKVPWRSDEMLATIEKAMGLYQRVVSAGGWPQIPGKKGMRPDDDDERVPALRRRLIVTGDMRGGGYADSYTYDSEVQEGVRRFQARHGLRESGRVDQPTLAALNVSAQERLDQLRLNYQRVSDLLQQQVEQRYVLVNVAGYQLEAVDNYQVEQRHRVIVGRLGRDTPTLRASIKAMNFFPYWRVPDSVAKLDLIPRLQKEPEYLAQEKIRVYQDNFNGLELDPAQIDWTQADYQKIKFKQDPGEQNALGLVRLDMPNSEGVYMHDTPMKDLFRQAARPFSAGCVRVQGVFELAEWIARYEPGWEQPGQVEAILQGGQAVDLNLSRPVTVFFTYITAWADTDGRVQFRADIYNRDGHQSLSNVDDPDAPAPTAGLAP
jgi:murein L,D-transpeptidase YcbB/YkuD